MNRLQLVTAVLGLLGAFAACGQEAVVRTSPPPHYVGVPVDIQVITQGFDEAPEPEIVTPDVPGAAFRFVGLQPNRMESTRIIGGQISRWVRVQHVFQYQVTPTRAGPVIVGQFTVTQGAKQATTRPLTLSASAVPTSGDYRLVVALPQGPVWIGQRVPISVEWWLAEDRVDRIHQRRARVPLFDRLDAFKFEDLPPPDRRATSLVFDTAAGPFSLRGKLRKAKYEGRDYLVVTFERNMTPLKPGQFSLEPSSLVVEEAVRFSRNIFGDRVPSQVRRVRASSPAQTLSVRAAPMEDRPASYSGAVGTGFSIEVSAERTVVQAGDPITLSIVIQGDTALETISLPPLASAGLDSGDFRVPEGDVAGQIVGTEGGPQSKRFEVTVRVLHDGVREIPPIELAWFDPDASSYRSVQSRPIALSVRRAEVVTATDVVRSQSPRNAPKGSSTPGDSPAPHTTPRPAPGQPTRRAEFILQHADLAIVTDTERLRRPKASVLAQWPGQAAAYTLAVLLLAGGLYFRRQRTVDKALLENIAEGKRRLSLLKGARADGLSEHLRALGQLAPAESALRAELDSVIQACDEVSFAPDASAGPVTPELRERAAAVGRSLLLALEAKR